MAPPKRPLVLVVDDTEASRYAVVRTMASGGFETLGTGTGTEALRMAKEVQPDVITLDIHLPDINGFEVCRRLKADPVTAHIPVLQVSASYVTERDRIHGLEGGADSYLTHPFEPPVLIATIKSLLRSRKLVDELRIAEQEQKRMAEEASLANQAKSRFLSNMSHEIRTPLGIIQGFAELALDDAISADERKSYLQTIKKNAEGLSQLLGDILDLSKVEAGKVDVELVEFDFAELLSETITAFRLRTAEAGLILDFKALTSFPSRVKSDPTRVRQILINLLSNATKFTSSGAVTVQVRSAPTEGGHTLVTVGVRDTGIGLRAEERERIFQPFVQADDSITRKFGGTGLGLNLSKKLAQTLRGDLTLVESVQKVGSLFEFSFDAGQCSEDGFVDQVSPVSVSSGPSQLVAKKSLNGFKVLVVDDSEDNQTLFSRYLAIAGAEVTLAANGREALDIVKQQRFDAILMDLQMPIMDGYVATAQLRADGMATPIIALTAFALVEQWERALQAGCTDIVTKPVNMSLLIEKLRLAVVRSDLAHSSTSK